jgi:hypothetical protein
VLGQVMMHSYPRRTGVYNLLDGRPQFVKSQTPSLKSQIRPGDHPTPTSKKMPGKASNVLYMRNTNYRRYPHLQERALTSHVHALVQQTV